MGILRNLDSGFWISLRVRPWRCSWWDVYPVWLGGSLMLVHDYIHPTPHGGRCRVRIYDATTVVPVIVCTELTDNPGQSITNAAKQIAAEVLENHPHVFDPFALASIAGLSYDKPFVWVEHYEDGARGTPSDPATFDLVEFSHYEVRGELRAGQWAKEIGSPLWKRLDRASVESLIGGPVD
jgi:hypothetical protein